MGLSLPTPRAGRRSSRPRSKRCARSSVSVPAPREIVVSGRLARLPELIATLASSLGAVAPVVALVPGRASAAARGGALLADGLAGGPNAALAEVLRLRESSGTVLDYLRVAGAEDDLAGLKLSAE